MSRKINDYRKKIIKTRNKQLLGKQNKKKKLTPIDEKTDDTKLEINLIKKLCC